MCEACKRLNYSCLREEPRALPPRAHTWKNPPRLLQLQQHGSMETAEEEPLSSSSSPTPDAQLCRTPNASGVPENSNVPASIASARKEMLRYYIQTLSILLTTNLENNCFLSGEWGSLCESEMVLLLLMSASSIFTHGHGLTYSAQRHPCLVSFSYDPAE